jgi:hypothetical protein
VLAAGRALGQEILLHAAHLATQTDAADRHACAELLAVLDARPGGASPTPPMLERLRLMIERGDPSVRLAGLRAAAHYADARLLVPIRGQLVTGGDPSVSAAAVRALAAIGDPAPIASWLAGELDGAHQHPARFAGPALPLVRLALESLRPAAESDAVQRMIDRSAAALVSRDTDPPRVALGRALIRCGVAELHDLAQGWPSHLTDCGAPTLPAAWGEMATARVLAQVPGSDEVRAARLAQIAGGSSKRARRAALTAARSLPPAFAAPLLARALGDDDPAVAAEAAAGVAWLGVSLSSEATLRKALLQAGSRVVRHPELVSPWMTAVRVLDLREAVATLQELGRHPAPGLHGPALELLREWGATLPDGQRPVSDPLPVERMPDPGARFHVKLRTTAGTFEVALDTARAPVASMRLVQRVRGGFLDDRPVGPLLVGALLGLETGGSVLLRHEDAPIPIEAGSVLLLDHGRDTADGTLAVALSRRPAMDGRFTVLGRVTRGMQVVQTLHEWDRIQEAQVRVESGPAPSSQSETRPRTEPE